MKATIRPILITMIISLIVFLTIALSGFSPAHSVNSDSYKLASTTGILQPTATPPAQQDRSEVGSTDGITIMSFVIVAIVIIPIFLKRKSWSQE